MPIKKKAVKGREAKSVRRSLKERRLNEIAHRAYLYRGAIFEILKEKCSGKIKIIEILETGETLEATSFELDTEYWLFSLEANDEVIFSSFPACFCSTYVTCFLYASEWFKKNFPTLINDPDMAALLEYLEDNIDSAPWFEGFRFTLQDMEILTSHDDEVEAKTIAKVPIDMVDELLTDTFQVLSKDDWDFYHDHY